METKGKSLTGVVITNSGKKSRRIAVEFVVKHPKYGKYFRRQSRLAVHDELDQSGVTGVDLLACAASLMRKHPLDDDDTRAKTRVLLAIKAWIEVDHEPRSELWRHVAQEQEKQQ